VLLECVFFWEQLRSKHFSMAVMLVCWHDMLHLAACQLVCTVTYLHIPAA
jgi:hypothetical protein